MSISELLWRAWKVGVSVLGAISRFGVGGILHSFRMQEWKGQQKVVYLLRVFLLSLGHLE
jgi:hypothetical protein